MAVWWCCSKAKIGIVWQVGPKSVDLYLHSFLILLILIQCPCATKTTTNAPKSSPGQSAHPPSSSLRRNNCRCPHKCPITNTDRQLWVGDRGNSRWEVILVRRRRAGGMQRGVSGVTANLRSLWIGLPIFRGSWRWWGWRSRNRQRSGRWNRLNRWRHSLG